MVVVEGARAETDEDRGNDTPAEKKGKGRRGTAYGIPKVGGQKNRDTDDADVFITELK